MASNGRHTSSNHGDYIKALRRTAWYHLVDSVGMTVRPLKLRVKVTNRCNARCNMCSVWTMQENFGGPLPHEITLDGYKRLIDRNRAYFSNLARISFTGGEPTLREDLVEIIRAFSEAFPKADVSLNSNGFNPRRLLSIVEEIARFRRRMTVMISLDGIGEAHNMTRGVKRVFRQVENSIDSLIALKQEGVRVKVEVNHVMTEHNADELPGVFAFCRERGISFNPIYVITGELYDNEKLNLTYSQELKQKLLRNVEAVMKEDNSLQLREVRDMLMDRPREYDCWAGRTLLMLEDDGELYPNGGCPKNYLMGNVKDFDYDLKALLATQQARHVLDVAHTCRRCRLSCETLVTLRGPEAVEGYRRSHLSGAHLNGGDD